MFEDISKIRRAVNEIPAYEYFPYTYYVSKTGNIQYSPGENTIKVDAWLVELGDIGIAVYFVGDGVYLRGYRVDNTSIVEDDEVIIDIVDRFVHFLNGTSNTEYLPIKINIHTLTGISVLLGIDYEYIQRAVNEAMLRQILEDRVAAIFGDDVVVLSKRGFMYRYSGKEAVEMAKKYAFVVKSPVSAIAEFIAEQLGRNATFFIFESGSIVCSDSACREAPLPPNIARLVANKLSTFSAVDLTSRDPGEYREVRLYLPSTVAIGKRILYYLDSEGRIAAHMRTGTFHRFPYLLVFSRRGFLGYGVLTRDKVKIVETEEAEGGEEGEDYLEETVHIS